MRIIPTSIDINIDLHDAVHQADFMALAQRFQSIFLRGVPRSVTGIGGETLSMDNLYGIGIYYIYIYMDNLYGSYMVDI